MSHYFSSLPRETTELCNVLSLIACKVDGKTLSPLVVTTIQILVTPGFVYLEQEVWMGKVPRADGYR